MQLRRLTLDGREYLLVLRKQWETIARKALASEGKPLKMPSPLFGGSYSIEHVRISLANKMIARR